MWSLTASLRCNIFLKPATWKNASIWKNEKKKCHIYLSLSFLFRFVLFMVKVHCIIATALFRDHQYGKNICLICLVHNTLLSLNYEQEPKTSEAICVAAKTSVFSAIISPVFCTVNIKYSKLKVWGRCKSFFNQNSYANYCTYCVLLIFIIFFFLRINKIFVAIFLVWCPRLVQNPGTLRIDMQNILSF